MVATQNASGSGVHFTTSVRKKILLVDDDCGVRSILSDILFSMGYEVVQAGNGSEGVCLFDSQVFDIVLTDMDMPGINGFGLALYVKEKVPCTPVLLMTGGGRDFNMKTAKGVPFNQILFKPFGVNELERTLQSLLVGRVELPQGATEPRAHRGTRGGLKPSRRQVAH